MGPIDNTLALIGLDNGLAQNMRQAVMWTNADPIHWPICAALGGDNLSTAFMAWTNDHVL